MEPFLHFDEEQETKLAPMKYSMLIVILLIIACQDLIRDIEFKRLEEVQIQTTENKKAKLKGTFILYNPNPAEVDIREANFDVWLDGKTIGTIQQSLDATLPANGEEGVTLEMDLDLSDILTLEKGGILDMGLKLLRKEDLMVTYNGKFKTGRSSFSLPIKVEKSINLSEKRNETDVP